VPVMAMQGRNDFGEVEYGGPQPPSGSIAISSKRFALDAMLPLGRAASPKIWTGDEGHVLESATLMASSPIDQTVKEHYRRNPICAPGKGDGVPFPLLPFRPPARAGDWLTATSPASGARRNKARPMCHRFLRANVLAEIDCGGGVEVLDSQA